MEGPGTPARPAGGRAGAPCPVSAIDERVDWREINTFGDGIGRGPVYPGMGSEDATLALRSVGTPWLRSKVFWYVKPSYRGRVLIRGRRLDAHGSLRFGEERLVAPVADPPRPDA